LIRVNTPGSSGVLMIGRMTIGVLFMASAVMVDRAAGAPPRLEEGKSFPDIVLPSIEDGRPMSIRDFRGEKVILHVFASW
jgi:hypothetical protein